MVFTPINADVEEEIVTVFPMSMWVAGDRYMDEEIKEVVVKAASAPVEYMTDIPTANIVVRVGDDFLSEEDAYYEELAEMAAMESTLSYK